jgi:hypothetical protein
MAAIFKIKLDLGSHCIATETKKIYNQSVNELIRKKANDTHLEMMVDMLQAALEQFDFGMLRAKFKALAGGTDAEIALVLSGEKTIHISVNNKLLEPVAILDSIDDNP